MSKPNEETKTVTMSHEELIAYRQGILTMSILVKMGMGIAAAAVNGKVSPVELIAYGIMCKAVLTLATDTLEDSVKEHPDVVDVELGKKIDDLLKKVKA